jgi:hypothetical protein
MSTASTVQAKVASQEQAMLASRVKAMMSSVPEMALSARAMASTASALAMWWSILVTASPGQALSSAVRAWSAVQEKSPALARSAAPCSMAAETMPAELVE